MLFESQTADAIESIRQGRGIVDRDQWSAILAAAKAWKPSGYDSTVAKLRAQYEGRFADQVQAAAAVRFPFTAHRMPPAPLNFARLFAHNAASVYDWPPVSYLERKTADGVKVELDDKSTGPDAQRAQDFAALVKLADMQTTMAEAERRAALGGDVVIRALVDSVTARATGQPPRVRLQIFWGCDVYIIPHPSAPTEIAAAAAVIVRVASPDGVASKSQCFELWSRGYTEDASGVPTAFGHWTVQRVTVRPGAKGDEVAIEPVTFATHGSTSDTYPLARLPFVVWHDGLPDGCPFMPPRENLAPLFIGVCTSMMAEQYASDMSSATPLVRKTNAQQPTTLALGPGIMPSVPLEDDIIPIAMSADFSGMRSVSKGMLGALALTSRQRVEGFDVEAQGEPVSGVALKIKGEPQTKARRESLARAIVAHESLLAAMIELSDYYCGTSIADPAVVARMRPADPPEYEDREVTTRRLLTLRDAGLATDAEVRVLAGLSKNAEDAEAALAKVKEEKAARADARLKMIGEAPPEPLTESGNDEDGEDDEPNAGNPRGR